MKVAGTAYFTVNGERLSLKASFLIGLVGAERETVVGLDGIHGYKELPAPKYIEATVTDRPDFDINATSQIDDGTVTAELNNGKVAVLRNCWQINNAELNVDEGEVVLRFEGAGGEWIQ